MIKRVAISVASICGLLFIGIVVFFTIAVITSEGSVGCTLPSGRTITASGHLYISSENTRDTATTRASATSCSLLTTTERGADVAGAATRSNRGAPFQG